jgi:hypothetical protein
MMMETLCSYPERDELLVSYLYEDIDVAERSAFGSHLSTCRYCQDDLSALRGVRSTLSTWTPPEPARAFLNDESRAASRASRAWWHEMPAWAQVAAALFVAGLSATVANLDVRYDRSGLSIRTGWSKPQVSTPAPVNGAPWRAELTALGNQLRSEMKTSQAVATAVSAPREKTAMSDAEFRTRVRVLLDESERKQQNELAFRLVQFQRDINAQHQADLTKFSQNIGFIQRETNMELLKQREGMNYLLKVSQRQ